MVPLPRPGPASEDDKAGLLGLVADRGVLKLGAALGFLLYLELRPSIRC